MEKVLVKRLSDQAILPTRASPLSAGLYLYSAHSLVIQPHERGVISTDISVRVPPSTYARVAGRSGLALSQGISILGGVCDEGYTGNIRIITFNTGNTPFTVSPGQRVAQLIIERISYAVVEEVSELPTTVRGDTGFGSSGL